MAEQEAAALGAAALPGGGAPEVVEWVETGTARPRSSGPAGPVPDRSVLPPLDRYATLEVGGGCRTAGSTVSSVGCRHRCRHCPVPVVWDGRIRVVPEEQVLADVDQQAAAGMRHLSFADPDFLNAPIHARRVAAAVHARHPGLTWDCTTKVEHILAHAELWPDLAAAGLLFVISAVESLDDAVLAVLDKGHTGADATAAVAMLRRSGIELRPSLLPFTPWTTVESLGAVLRWVADLDLIGNVDPVQFTVRLLVPPGSLLLGRPELAAHLADYDGPSLSWVWHHPDPAIDDLQRRLADVVERGVAAGHGPVELFPDVWQEVDRAGAGLGPPPAVPESARGRARLSEAWFCCSEPTAVQLGALGPLGAQLRAQVDPQRTLRAGL